MSLKKQMSSKHIFKVIIFKVLQYKQCPWNDLKMHTFYKNVSTLSC